MVYEHNRGECRVLGTLGLGPVDGVAKFFQQRPEGNPALGIELLKAVVDVDEHLPGVGQSVLGERQVAVVELFERIVDETKSDFHVSLDEFHGDTFPRPMLLSH